MQLSVIITTYNNTATIASCLNSFRRQTLPADQYEIVIVSDGSTDDTNHIIEQNFTSYANVQFFKQENKGVAAARNLGASKAKNEVLFFTQADIIAHDELLERHLKYHVSYPSAQRALVGYTTWHLDTNATPFMQWLENGGPQFNFSRVRLGEKTDFLTFYTTNLSIKREFFLHSGGFDTHFKGPAGITAYEDTDLGFRLQKAGLELYYEPKAITYHKHHKTLRSVLKRRYYEGIMAHVLAQKHPDLKWERTLSDKQLFWLSVWILNPIICLPLTMIATGIQKWFNTPPIYKLVTRAYYNWGFAVGYLKSK